MAISHRIGNALVQPGSPLQPRPDRLRVGVRPGGVGLQQLRVERLRGAERVEVGAELAVESQSAAVVSGHGGQVVGDLIPGVEVCPLAGMDFAELAVPVLQAPLEVPFSSGVAPLPVAPAAHIGRRLREVERPEWGLDVCPLLARC
jgi:hypothetical protein